MTRLVFQSFFSEDVKVTDSEWQEMEAAGGITLTAQHRSALEASLTTYREHADMLKAAVRSSKVRPRLVEIAVALEASAKALTAGSDPLAEAALREIQRAAATGASVYAGHGPRRELRDQLWKWSTFARAAANSMPTRDKGAGRKPSAAGLLLAAHSVFRAAGGDRTYTSSSRRFLKAVCAKVGHKFGTDGSLDKELKAALASIGD